MAGHLKELPNAPGVYFLKGRGRPGAVDFVAQSEDLRSCVPEEVCSRLQAALPDDLDQRSRPASVAPSELNYIVTGSVIEAELLELDFIRHYRPEVNLRKDAAREAVYLHVDHSHPFPIFEVNRRYPDAGSAGFGPFFEPDKLRRGLEVGRRILRLRYCSEPFPPPDYERCVRFAKQHCAGPCRGMISSAVYRGRLQRLISFLRGDDDRLLEDLRRTYQALPEEEVEGFDEGARDLLDVRRSLVDLAQPTEGARLLVTSPKDPNGRVTLLLFRRGRIIERARTSVDRSRTNRLSQRMHSALLAHQADPVGLLKPEELAAAQVVKRHINSPEPGEHVFQIPNPTELPRLLHLAFRQCERTTARTC